MRVLSIVKGTIVDGPGLRTSVYLAGCSHHCLGCHNPSTHDPSRGAEMTAEEIAAECAAEELPVTLTGGDPLYNPTNCVELCRALNAKGVGDIWVYTGYMMEQIQNDPCRAAVLPYISGLVDGRFIEGLRDENLKFRGSSNQRIWRKGDCWYDATGEY